MEQRRQDHHSDSPEEKYWRTDPISGEITLIVRSGRNQTSDLVNGLKTGSELHEIWTIQSDEPTSAKVEITWERWLTRDDITARSVVATYMSTTANHFEVAQTLTAFKNDVQIFQKEMQDKIAR